MSRWIEVIDCALPGTGVRRADATVAAVGDETEGSFGKVFKRDTGTSPGESRATAGRRSGIKDAG
jgi:hypothetical protein